MNSAPMLRAVLLSVLGVSADSSSLPVFDVHTVTLSGAISEVEPPVAKVTGPSGEALPDVVAFKWQEVRNGSVAEPAWQLRFAPQLEGAHVLRPVSGATGKALGKPVRLNVTAPVDATGFVKVGPNRRHMVGSNGKLFLPLGLNIAWQKGRAADAEATVAYYEDYFRELASHGGNFARVWLGPNIVGHGLSGLAMLKSGYDSIDPVAASLLDRVLESANRHGVRLILVLESFNTLCPDIVGSVCKWKRSVYNKQNGGPLSGTLGFLGFWTNKLTVAAWKSYITHAARRWGPYRSIFAWQLFNEVDAAMLEVVLPAYQWHRDMAAHFRAQDRYNHLLSESWGLALGNPVLDAGGLFDFTTTHEYTRHGRGSQDLGVAIAELVVGKTKLYDKPNLVGEFGCDDIDGTRGSEPRGGKGGGRATDAAVHQGFWTPLFAGAAGSGLTWFWQDDDVRQATLREVSVLRSFLSLVEASVIEDVSRLHWQPTLPLGSPKQAFVIAVEGRPLPRGQPAAVLMLLRSKAWSRPCVPNTTSLDVDPFELTLALGRGLWSGTWMDPRSGTLARAELSASLKGQRLSVPAFSQDLALLLARTEQTAWV